MGPKLKTSKPFRGKIMDGGSSISSYFSKAVPVPDPAPAPAAAPAPRRPIWEGLPDLGEHLRAGGKQPSPSAGNGTGGWKPWNSSAMSVEPAAEGERGELSTPPSSFYSMGILGAGDKGDGDALTPERSRGKGKARAANDQPGKWARTTPPSPGFDVAHAPLEPHQSELFDMTTAAMGDPTFASNRAKMGEIAREAAKAKGMGGDASIYDVLREACGEYGLHQVLALDQLRKRPLTNNEMEKGGIEVFDQGKDYAGQVNYVHAYEFWCKETTLAMVEAWESEMGVGSALCGSVRAKVNRHDWDDNGALRLLISGEGLSDSAHKYARGLQQPTAVRARQPRQVNGRVANDGPAWNVPAGLVLVGGDAIDRVGTETYVWRTGDPHRSSRELHEAILALVFLGGLVWCPESVGLNQKVGGTFNDEQRARGGRANYSGEQKGRDKSTNELKAEGGTKGDPDLKAAGARTGRGNVSGSIVPYTARLEGFPDIPLYCSKCEGDWRSFEGVKRRNNGQLGIPQGIVDDQNRVVFLRQERHWGCGNCRCKPPEDATVTRNGVPYEVRSGADNQFRVTYGG